LITKWRTAHREYAERAFAGNGNRYCDEARIAELERLVGQLTMENALLKKPCCGSRDNCDDPAAMKADHV